MEELNIIEKIHGFLKFGSVLGLERMNELLKRLGNPEKDLRIIHVAGTNGKGSVSRFIYEMLESAGYKAGLYTSPYLEYFNERIEYDGKLISMEDLERCGDVVIRKAGEMTADGLDSPTEFEVVTAIAFLYFKEVGCQTAVMEVGLGGRGDSTNVVEKPLCSVITSISMDHMNVLGNTIAEIAGEKAGIIKRGCPVVISTDRKDAKRVFLEKAVRSGSRLVDAMAMEPEMREIGPGGSRFDIEALGKEYEDIEISMGGTYQIRNAVEALTAVTLLNQEGKVNVPESAVKAGMKRAVNRGRFEMLASGEDGLAAVILDGAHNADGALKLRESIERFYGGKKVLIVTGVLADKQFENIVGEFRKIADDFIVTEPENPRKMKADDLAALISETGADVTAVPDVEEAVDLAVSRRKDYDLVLFTGSLYMIGKARTVLTTKYGIGKPLNI
ncbi:MAG: bifunctional folylpolyglutamate synthase/dihydrofolate synthase [Eubacteriales bacterium]|nr:bifunctional folylpolyglutamate synthase/dihydrofolate synthase [Eubacteriales bacterium]